jgi:hypothetical protein
MAEATIMTHDRAQHFLRTIREEADRLANDPDGSVGPAVPVEDRMAFRAEWANEVGRFALLVQAYDSEQLDAASIYELGSVAGKLAELLPLLEHLRLRAPALADLERLKAASAA